ncbi:MAG: CdaR family protein [Desulfuromonadales bacterium]|nr:CdaR family protein [Desulfuromonadales bacterium]
MKGLFTQNWHLKLISLAFAVVLWFFVMGERRLEVAYIVPIEYRGLSSELTIANEVPSSVDVRISGPRALLMNLSSSDISIAVDLKDLTAGMTSFRRIEESMNIPSGLKVTRLSPSFVDVRLEKIRDKQVPVVVVLTGQPVEGVLVEEHKVSPQRVTVTGAESELKGVSEVATEGVELTGVRESFSQTVALVYPGKYTRLKDVQTVEVQVFLKPDPEYLPPEPLSAESPLTTGEQTGEKSQ